MNRIDVLNSLLITRYRLQNGPFSLTEAEKFAHGYLISTTQVMFENCRTKEEMLDFIERRISKIEGEVAELRLQQQAVTEY